MALAKKSQNPISNMRSFKFQNNANLGIGPDDSTQNMLNIMPVLPLQLNDDMLVISRTIIPVAPQPSVLTPPNEDRVKGIADTSMQFFFSPMDTSSTGGTVWVWVRLLYFLLQQMTLWVMKNGQLVSQGSCWLNQVDGSTVV